MENNSIKEEVQEVFMESRRRLNTISKDERYSCIDQVLISNHMEDIIHEIMENITTNKNMCMIH